MFQITWANVRTVRRDVIFSFLWKPFSHFFTEINEDSDTIEDSPSEESYSVARENLNEAPHLMTKSEAEILTSALLSQDNQLLEKVLVTLSNSAAFTQNQV